jgi:hypothetical protein
LACSRVNWFRTVFRCHGKEAFCPFGCEREPLVTSRETPPWMVSSPFSKTCVVRRSTLLYDGCRNDHPPVVFVKTVSFSPNVPSRPTQAFLRHDTYASRGVQARAVCLLREASSLPRHCQSAGRPTRPDVPRSQALFSLRPPFVVYRRCVFFVGTVRCRTTSGAYRLRACRDLCKAKVEADARVDTSTAGGCRGQDSRSVDRITFIERRGGGDRDVARLGVFPTVRQGTHKSRVRHVRSSTRGCFHEEKVQKARGQVLGAGFQLVEYACTTLSLASWTDLLLLELWKSISPPGGHVWKPWIRRASVVGVSRSLLARWKHPAGL